MSLSFGGVTFSLRWEADFDPLVEREAHLSVEHYPETNTDEVQFGGVGQGKVTLPAWLSSLDDLEALRSAMAIGTADTLLGMLDGDHEGMLLVAIAGIGIYSVGSTTRIKCDLDFLETS